MYDSTIEQRCRFVNSIKYQFIHVLAYTNGQMRGIAFYNCIKNYFGVELFGYSMHLPILKVVTQI